MNKRPLIYLAVAIIFTIVVFIIERPSAFKGSIDEGLFYPGFETKDVDECTIGQLLTSSRMKRFGESWKVSEHINALKAQLNESEKKPATEEVWYDADMTRVNSAIANFADLEKGVRVSNNPNLVANYRLGPDAIRVTCKGKDGKNIVDILIGKNGPDYVSTYLKRNGGDEVYLVSRSLAGVFSTSVDDWRDKKIAKIEPIDVSSMEINFKKFNLKIVKDENGEWQVEIPAGKRIGIAKVNDIVEDITSLYAAGFIYGKGFDRVDGSVAVSTKDGKVLKIMFGAKGVDGNVPLKIDGGDTVYYLRDNDVDRMLKSWEEAIK